MNDLLIVTHAMEECQQATEKLLEMLQQLVCHISSKKAQPCSNKVTYLGYCLESSRKLFLRRIQALLNIPELHYKRQVKAFWEWLNTSNYGHPTLEK